MCKQLQFNLSYGRTRPPKYKGQDGRLYEREIDARNTFGYGKGSARWELVSALFDPPHYVFIEFVN